MLDITTNNQSSSNLSFCSYSIAAAEDDVSELLDDDMMDPLFDEDWLHENNLDILFDLFEEEIESKIGVDSNNGSSTLFGTSPVTSYLFGTPPSLASALDLLYVDNQQQFATNSNNLAAVQQQHLASAPTTAATLTFASDTCANSSTASNSSAHHSYSQTSNKSTKEGAQGASGQKVAGHRKKNRNSVQQVGPAGHDDAIHTSDSITNAMRIKRGMKRSQSEGVSLLAKPFASNSAKATSSNASVTSHKNISKVDKSNSIISKNSGDKTSAKIAYFKSSTIIGNSNDLKHRSGIDINYSKQNQQQRRERYYLHNCQHHAHYITGRAIMHEHAYAIRGH